jgi:hypothetical protein
MKPLSIDESKSKIWDKLASTPPDVLEKWYAALAASSNTVLNNIAFERAAAGAGIKEVSPVIGNILSLRNYAEIRQRSSADVVQQVRAGLADFGWTPEKLAELDRRIPIISKILGSDATYFTLKYIELYFEGERGLTSAKIYSDVKPVFAPNRENVQAYLLFSKLNITYSDKERRTSESLSVYMDIDDVRKLIDECNRAIKKYEALKQELATKTGRYVMLVGEDAS